MAHVHKIGEEELKYIITLEGDANEDDITAIFEDLVRSLHIIATENTEIKGSLNVGTTVIASEDVDLTPDMAGPDVEPIDN